MFIKYEFVILLITLVLFSCNKSKIIAFRNVSLAMANTLEKGKVYRFKPEEMYSRNDIVAIRNVDFISGVEKHSVFRIIAIRGDSLYYKNGVPYVNGKEFLFPETSKRYYITFQRQKVLGLIKHLHIYQVMYSSNDTIIFNLTKFEKQELEKKIPLKEYSLNREPDVSYTHFKCCSNHDFFGPISLPVKVNEADSAIILHKGKWSSKLASEPLYFVAGDNIQESFDSRYIGLVPHSYIIGKIMNTPITK